MARSQIRLAARLISRIEAPTSCHVPYAGFSPITFQELGQPLRERARSLHAVGRRHICDGPSVSQLNAEMALESLEKAAEMLQEGRPAEMKSYYAEARVFAGSSEVFVAECETEEVAHRPLLEFMPALRRDANAFGEQLEQFQQVLATAIAAVTASAASTRLDLVSGIAKASEKFEAPLQDGIEETSQPLWPRWPTAFAVAAAEIPKIEWLDLRQSASAWRVQPADAVSS